MFIGTSEGDGGGLNRVNRLDRCLNVKNVASNSDERYNKPCFSFVAVTFSGKGYIYETGKRETVPAELRDDPGITSLPELVSGYKGDEQNE